MSVFNSLAFLFASVALAWYSQHGHTIHEAETLAVIALVAWTLEGKSLARKPVDFSAGFVFYLSVAFMGDAVAAELMVLGGLSIRSMTQKYSPADLWMTGLVVAFVGGLQMSVGVFLQPAGRVALGIVALAAWCLGFRALNSTLTRKLRGSKVSLLAREEHAINNFRFILSLYSLIGVAVPLSHGWLVAGAAPLCYLAVEAARNTGFRVHAKEATSEKAAARETTRQLRQTEKELAQTSQRQNVLESVTDSFSGNLTPTEAFEELHRIALEVADFRSIILFRKMGLGILEPVMQRSPEIDLGTRANLTLASEPLVEKAWNADKPLRGVARKAQGDRLIPAEAHLLALPVKPFGLIYFGRADEPGFSKADAGRLWFVVQKAAPALLRADQDAQTQKTLKDQTEQSQKLEVQVALSSQLLKGAERLLACLTRQQILDSLQTILVTAVPHQLGVLILKEGEGDQHSWGEHEGESESLLALMDFVLKQGESLYLSDLQGSRFEKVSKEIDSLLVAPVKSEQSQFGVLVVGCGSGFGLSPEQRDFVRTCACLVASAMVSQSLTDKVKEAHQQVVQASKLSAIGQLAAGVAHELNSPLAAIGLALESALIRPEKAARKLERASDALEQARVIVSGLLEHSRHSGSVRQLLEPASVLKAALELVGPQLRKRQIDVKVECQEEQDMLLANATDMKQVLINLLLNAADASGDNSEVVLFSRQVEATLEMGVRDKGTGIPKDVQNRIFDPFFTTKPVGQGTGLGLSVCQQLVERHYGKLTFETEIDQGTCFTITVPARLEE